MEDKPLRLARAIEAAMKKKGLNRSEFSNLMGVQPSIVTRWLTGTHNFQIETLYKIEKALQTQILYIIIPKTNKK